MFQTHLVATRAAASREEPHPGAWAEHLGAGIPSEQDISECVTARVQASAGANRSEQRGRVQGDATTSMNFIIELSLPACLSVAPESPRGQATYSPIYST